MFLTTIVDPTESLKCTKAGSLVILPAGSNVENSSRSSNMVDID